MPSSLAFLAIAFVAGASLSPQALINARLAAGLGGGLQAATASFLVGTVVLTALLVVQGTPVPALAALRAIPLWAWIGGALGAIYVAGVIAAVPHIGAGATVALVVAGQMAAALVLDHFGVLQATTHPVTLPRLAGAAAILVGVVLVTRR